MTTATCCGVGVSEGVGVGVAVAVGVAVGVVVGVNEGVEVMIGVGLGHGLGKGVGVDSTVETTTMLCDRGGSGSMAADLRCQDQQTPSSIPTSKLAITAIAFQ
jgi:opacity protein-like surface antigen